MRHRLALPLASALLLAAAGFAQDRAPRPQDRPLIKVKPSLVDGARRVRSETSAPKAGKLERSPGRSLEDTLRELERIEAGERVGAPVRAQDRARASEKASASSSHTRRIVVRNGEVIVDEETRDGRPVRPSARERGTPRPGVGEALDAEQMLRELERELLRDLPGVELPKPGDRSSSSHSHTRRIVVRNGETIVDEETVDGRPVRPARLGAKPPIPDDRMQELLRQMEQQLVRDLERQGARDAAREVSRELERSRNEARDGQRGAAPEPGSSEGAPRSRGGRR